MHPNPKISIVHTFIFLLAATAFCGDPPPIKDEIETKPAAEALKSLEIPDAPRTDWSQVRGINYIPSYAASPYEFWRDYNPDVIRQDLSTMHRIGFNSVRIFLCFNFYDEKPTPFLKNFADFIRAAGIEDLTVMPILFDSWGAEPDPNAPLRLGISPGDYPKERKESVLTAYKKFISRPDAYRINPKNFERLMKVTAEKLQPDKLIPIAIDPSILFWGEWIPSPPHDQLGPQFWKRYKEYLKAVVEPRKANPTIIAWDIMNEPDAVRIFNEPSESGAIYDFAFEMLRETRKLGPIQALTVGAAGGAAGSRVFALRSDVVSIHAFQQGIPELSGAIREARKREKPIVVSACGAVLFPASPNDATDEGQSEHVQKILGLLRSEKVGYYLWQFTEGKSFAPWTALTRTNGDPKPAAQLLSKEIAR